jgi:periplasmic protein TonB
MRPGYRPRPHPRSPVQPDSSRPGAIVLLAAMAAFGVWAYNQYAMVDRPRSSIPEETRPSDSASSTPKSVTEGPQHARANLASFFSDDDYPVAAMRDDAQGLVSFRLTVGRDGRVKRCEIIVSAGHRSLDEATCRIYKARAKFEPAIDRDGNRVEDQVSGKIRWVLPA